MNLSVEFQEPPHGDRRRVLIVDDHQIFRDGLRELLATEEGYEVCGEAGNSEEALRLFQELRPHLVTVDISLAKGNGLQLVEKLRALDPKVVVLIISMYDESVYADRATATGANGYVCKQASTDEIREAFRFLRRHGAYIGRDANNRRPVSPGDAPRTEESLLSTRELQIFTLLGQGESTQSIAEQLKIAASTVETYRERIKGKLDIPNGAELTRRAILWLMHKT